MHFGLNTLLLLVISFSPHLPDWLCRILECFLQVIPARVDRLINPCRSQSFNFLTYRICSVCLWETVALARFLLPLLALRPTPRPNGRTCSIYWKHSDQYLCNGVRVCVDGEVRIRLQSQYFMHGNNVTSGPSDLAPSPRLSIIDTAHPLSWGQLTNFYVYASPTADQAVTAERRIQLQIWRLVSSASSQYRLVWQQLAYVNASSSTGALLTVS